MSGKFDYDTVFNKMSPEMIDRANTALDLQIEAEEKAIKKGQKKR